MKKITSILLLSLLFPSCKLETTKDCNQVRSNLIVQGEQIVKANLKAPSTAKFPGFLTELDQVFCEEDSLTIQATWLGYVDA